MRATPPSSQYLLEIFLSRDAAVESLYRSLATITCYKASKGGSNYHAAGTLYAAAEPGTILKAHGSEYIMLILQWKPDSLSHQLTYTDTRAGLRAPF